jgi:arylsulfatase A-like enzyme
MTSTEDDATPEGFLGREINIQPSVEDVMERSKKFSPDYAPSNALITWLDDSIGAVMNKLKELNIERDTLVIFLSDHQSKGKFSSQHIGAHVPFAVYWKGKIEAGGVSDSLVASIDIAATMYDVCGVKMPKGISIDGKSMKPLFTNPKAKIRDHLLVEFGFSRAVISDQYQYVTVRFPEGRDSTPESPRLYNGNKNRTSMIKHNTEHYPHFFDKDQLYDIKNDYFCQTNLYNDSKYKQVAEEHREILSSYLKDFYHAYGEFK